MIVDKNHEIVFFQNPSNCLEKYLSFETQNYEATIDSEMEVVILRLLAYPNSISITQIRHKLLFFSLCISCLIGVTQQ